MDYEVGMRRVSMVEFEIERTIFYAYAFVVMFYFAFRALYQFYLRGDLRWSISLIIYGIIFVLLGLLGLSIYEHACAYYEKRWGVDGGPEDNS